MIVPVLECWQIFFRYFMWAQLRNTVLPDAPDTLCLLTCCGPERSTHVAIMCVITGGLCPPYVWQSRPPSLQAAVASRICPCYHG